MTPKENLLRCIRHAGPQWVPNGMEAVVSIASPVVERQYKAGLDAFGVLWDLEEGAQGGTFPAHGGHPVKELSAWRIQVKMPDLDRLDWESVRAQAAAVNRSECLVCGFIEMGLFERAYLLLGMENALISFLTEPDLMLELVAAIADYKVRLIGRFHEAAGLDMLWYGDDWGTQDSLFVPPATWRRVIRPPTQRIYDALKERGIIIDQHSCGRIESVFEDMVEMGADIWNPCQPCNNLAALKKKFAGKICFCGGIDSQFVLDKPGVMPGEIRAEVRKRIDQLADDGGYIAAPSHTVPYKKELLDAMNDEIAVYGRAFYRNTSSVGND